MEEKWIKIITLKKVKNLVEQKYILEESMNFWREIFNKNEIEHKFNIEQITEYTNGFKKGQFQSKYVLNLYCRNKDKEKIDKILKEYSTSNKAENEEIIQEEYEELMPVKLSKYFIIGTMIMLLVLEVYMALTYEGNIFILVVVAIIEIIIIIKTKKKKRKNNE